MKTKIKWALAFIALVLLLGNFEKEEDVSSFVPFSVADGFQLSPSAKYTVLQSQAQTPQQEPWLDVHKLAGLALLGIVVFSKDE